MLTKNMRRSTTAPVAKPARKPLVDISIEKPARPKSDPTPNPDTSNDLDRDLAGTLNELNIDQFEYPPEMADSDSESVLDEKISRRSERKRLKREKKQKHRKRRRVVRICILFIVLALVGTGVWFSSSIIHNVCKIIKCDASNIWDVIGGVTSPSTPLDADKNGRTNILIFGTADDDAGHEGGNLTDSIMIVSLNQKKHDAFMFSIPRDLWVKYGRACPSGYQGRINVFYSCAGGVSGNPAEDREALKESIELFSDILGIEIQYAANVNYTVLRDAVNAVGGKITVTIDSTDERGILDSSFDNFCGKTADERRAKCPSGHFLQLTNGDHEIDADMALSLSLARGHEGALSYGLSRSNFDRELNQQAVLRGILNQAKKSGVLTNISQFLPLVDSLGNNLRTTFDVKDISKIKTLIELAPKINVNEIQSFDLFGEGLFISDMVNEQSVIVPAAGTFNYSEIHKFLQESLNSSPLHKEKAAISVYNATETVGEAGRIAKLLSDQDLNASAIGNTDPINAKYAIYDLTGGTKPETARTISRALSNTPTKVIKRSELPNNIDDDADFVVIIGQ